MAPGEACNSCHATSGSVFAIAGTVYPTAHEPNDCLGTDEGSYGPISLIVTDSNQQKSTITVKQGGNFLSTFGAFALPYRVKVVSGGKERAMATAETNGDCNACHTEAGTNGAPGRIVAP